MLEKISELAKADLPVLLSGETGSGLEDVAREIHEQSRRHPGAFIAVSCATLGKGNAETVFFGKTGNDARHTSARAGKLERAEGGSLFLDQIDRLVPDAQDKLFKALASGKITRAGSQAVVPFDTRVIASCGPSFDANSEKNTLRKDFHHFLGALALSVPPLRERREDIPEIIHYFIRQYLMRYGWPGNLEELKNIIELMVLFAGKETLTLDDIPMDILVKQIELARTKEEAKHSLKRMRRHFERQFIRKVLERTRGNQTRTAATLGLASSA